MLDFINKLFKKEDKLRIYGCYDEHDENMFGSQVIAGPVTTADLTNKDFKTADFSELIDQKATDFCVACSGAYAKEATENVGKMSWAGAYALACKSIGYIPDYGMSISYMMDARCRYGIPEEKYYPYDASKSKIKIANWNNLPQSALDNASTHKDKSYFILTIPNGWSKFDTWRAYLNKFRDKKIVVNTGVNSHAVTLCEQRTIDGEIRLGGPDSYGARGLTYPIGITMNGWRYFTKAEIARFFSGYIGFDMDKTLAQLLNAYNGKAVKIENDSKCWLIKDGKRRYIRNEAIAWANNTLLYNDSNVETILPEELDSIPVGNPMTFKEGTLYPVVQRMLEKTSKMTQAEVKTLLEQLNNQ